MLTQSNPEVKKIGDALLKHVNFVIDIAAGDTKNYAKLNRWVYQRLQLLKDGLKNRSKQLLAPA
jgi:hypothetical protein